MLCGAKDRCCAVWNGGVVLCGAKDRCCAVWDGGVMLCGVCLFFEYHLLKTYTPDRHPQNAVSHLTSTCE